MTRLAWGAPTDRQYETGVDRGVLYLPTNGVYAIGYPWNGLTAITESPEGAEANPQYADNGKYLNLLSAEDFNATLEALTYPRQFAQCDGSGNPAQGVYISQQQRKTFGLAYRSLKGNDDVKTDLGYKLHLVYGALAAPSEIARNTVNDSPEPAQFSWELSTSPVGVAQVSGVNYRNTAHLTVDSTEITPARLAALEDILYGTGGTDPRLPLPDEVIGLMAAGTLTAVTVTAPTYNSSTHVITVPNTTGVTYRRGDTNADVTNSTVTLVSGQSLVIYGVAKPGYQLAPNTVDRYGFTY